MVSGTIARYEAVQRLVADGRLSRGISRELELNHYTVRRYACTICLEELVASATHRRILLGWVFKPYLHQGITTYNCHNASQLFRGARPGLPQQVQTPSTGTCS
ncbi:hypothetical protein ACFPOI_51285 [Nonomuraea angiospora]|uniref:HTH luxR-type domain-containing protein n=1 Tax=Nonomuraea angiospora TaxID=46172 RepID=A0ABR9M1G3_9ACTN|nr:hypothetical protein [Nonomuraea angiospora]